MYYYNFNMANKNCNLFADVHIMKKEKKITSF